MPSPSEIESNMRHCTETLISGFNTGHIDSIMANRSENCTQLILPKTLGRTAKNNDEARTHVKHVYTILTNWTFIADNVLYDVPSRKSCFHATSSATSPIGPFGNEYSFFLWFSHDGREIVKIEEMVDSGYTQQFFERMTAHDKDAEAVMRRDG